MSIFQFPDEARWDDEADALTFTVQVGEYVGTVFTQRRVFVSLMERRPTPEEADAFFHTNRPVFEKAVEMRIMDRALDPDANIHLTARDLRRAIPARPAEG